MDIFKTMKINLVLAILPLTIFAVIAVAVVSHYRGLVQIKGPMDTGLTVDGRFNSYPAKNQNNNYSLTDTDKLPPVH
jgi:hypothetical protein